MTIEETLTRAYQQLQNRFWTSRFGKEQRAAYTKLQLLAQELHQRGIC